MWLVCRSLAWTSRSGRSLARREGHWCHCAIRVRDDDVAVVDGFGRVFKTVEVPINIKNDAAWLKKQRKLAELLGELCRTVGRTPVACAVCDAKTWNDADYHASGQQIFCPNHKQDDARSLPAARRLEKMREFVEANQSLMPSPLSSPAE